jgi:23S rRNA pseudouridine1911/1915/1917 synthase
MLPIIIDETIKSQRIDSFIAQKFPQYSRGEISKLLKQGNITVNAKEVKPSYIVTLGDEIIFHDLSSLDKSLKPNFAFKPEIIFEDLDIIAINKPAGIQIHPSGSEKNNTLTNWLIGYLPEIKTVHDDSMEGYLRPGVVHRLDKDTSGITILAKNMPAFLELKKIFKDRLADKTYIAIAEGIFLEKTGIIDKPLAKSTDYKRQIVARNNTKTTIRNAETHYNVLKEYEKYSFVELNPKTGRMHQIRVHLASIGHPIIGDNVYAKRKNDDVSLAAAKRQLLHAKAISFELFDKKHSFETPIPDDFKEFLN